MNRNEDDVDQRFIPIFVYSGPYLLQDQFSIMHIQPVSAGSGYYEISRGVTKDELIHLSNDPDVKGIQISYPLGEKEIGYLEEVLFQKRPDISFRVYGHYSVKCDLEFLKDMPSLRKFSADFLMNATGIEAVIGLKDLEILGVGIFELQTFAFLEDINPNLKHLYLHRTRSKKPDIEAIQRFRFLEELYLEGQIKGIASIAELQKLKKVVLRSVSTPNVDYLSDLPELWSVDIKLGGIKNFNALRSLKNLKYLELWQVRELKDISFISDLLSLQNLFLQSLPHIESLPNLENLKRLRRIYLENLKSLTSLESIRTAVGLEELIYISERDIELEILLPVLQNPAVEKIGCGFRDENRKQLFERALYDHNKKSYVYRSFEYK